MMSPLLMLIPFGIVLTTGLIFIYLSSRHTQANPESETGTAPNPGTSSFGETGFCRGVLWQQPRRWLAIRTTDTSQVLKALQLEHAVPCNWIECLSRPEDSRLFVSPPVHGWVVVMGHGLPAPEDDVDLAFHFLVRLSQKLGEVHFYSMNRVVNHHAWIRVEAGHVIRAYAWAGETLWNQGYASAAEKKLGLDARPYAYATPETLHSTGGIVEANNTEKVPQLAACWSVDPTHIEEAMWNDSRGFSGNLSWRHLP